MRRTRSPRLFSDASSLASVTGDEIRDDSSCSKAESEEETEDDCACSSSDAAVQQQYQEVAWYGTELDVTYEQLLEMCTSLTRTFTVFDIIDTIPGVELPDNCDNFENISYLLVKYGDWQRVQDTTPAGGFLYYPTDTQLVVLDESQCRLLLERQCAWGNNDEHDNDITMQQQVNHGNE